VATPLRGAGRHDAADQAGTVVRLRGAAIAVLGEVGRALVAGDAVHYGERITTDADTRLQLRLIDGAVITLGDHSTFTIQGYEPEEDGPVFDIVNGVFLGISGAVEDGKKKPMTINTALGTIGIRGTTFWGRVDPGHLQVGLIEGHRVFVEAYGRRVELTPDANGVDVWSREAAARKLVTRGLPVLVKKWEQKRIDASFAQVSFE